MSLQNEQQTQLQERRAATRVPYQVELLVACTESDEVPSADQFHSAETRNLSPMGISFFSEREYEPQQAVILRLGGQERPIYLSGTIVHCQHDRWGESDQFFVGVQFNGRISQGS